jgi:glycosyltransferase involved in cell wall biosynthesis
MDGCTGLLVPPNDADALGDALAKIYCDPALRAKFSRLATRRVNALFTWKRVASAIAEIYEDVLSSRHPHEFEPSPTAWTRTVGLRS